MSPVNPFIPNCFCHFTIPQKPRHNVVEHLKALFYRWAELKFGFRADVFDSENLRIRKFKDHLEERFPTLGVMVDITTTSMFATMYPLLLDQRRRYELNISQKAAEIFEFLHEKRETPDLHPYVRLIWQLNDPHFNLDVHKFDLRWFQSSDAVHFYANEYDYHPQDWPVRNGPRDLLAEKLHANFQGADLRYSILRGTFIENTAFDNVNRQHCENYLRYAKRSSQRGCSIL